MTAEQPVRVAMIPGAREPRTTNGRPAGSMGGSASGSAGVPSGPSSLDAATILERQREGGGAPRERQRT